MDATDFAQNANYLKADELKGRTLVLEIEEIEVAKFDEQDQKLVIYFKGKDRGIVLNKTNTKNLINAFGAETDNWKGKKIQASPNDTPMGVGFAIREWVDDKDFDDEIPF